MKEKCKKIILLGVKKLPKSVKGSRLIHIHSLNVFKK